MNIVQKYEAKQLETIQAERNIPNFAPGDTVRVNVKIKEGTTERVQAYEGVCIARAGTDMSATFTVRKISHGEGVERVFPLWSPRLESIELVRRGSVRRAKLYYLRDRRGKSARIAERIAGHGIEKKDENEIVVSKTERAKAKKAAKAQSREENKKAREEADAAKLKAKEEAAKAAEAEAKAAADAAAAEAAAADTPAEGNEE